MGPKLPHHSLWPFVPKRDSDVSTPPHYGSDTCTHPTGVSWCLQWRERPSHFQSCDNHRQNHSETSDTLTSPLQLIDMQSIFKIHQKNVQYIPNKSNIQPELRFINSNPGNRDFLNSNLLFSGDKTLAIARVLTLLINKFSCICDGQSWWVRITVWVISKIHMF